MLYARFIFFSFDIKHSTYLKLGFWKDQRTSLQIPAKVDHMILSDMTDLRESSVSCDLVVMPHFTIKISQEIHVKAFTVIANIALMVYIILSKKLQKIVLYK